jgi:hypothetical protein
VSFAGRIAPGNRPAATIREGVAVNREGRTLRLTRDVTIALSREPKRASDAVRCLFGDCDDTAIGDYVAGQGLYLLTVAPAFVGEGKAPTSGFDEANVRCNTDATVEALRFRLVGVPTALLVDAGGSLSFAGPDFRNRVAYRAFGRGVFRSWAADPLGSEPRRDDLVAALELSRSEVPLALMAFTGTFAHLFTDNWSVRRSLSHEEGASALTCLGDPRRIGVGEAMFRQFQGHVRELAAANGSLGQATARSRFRSLPPVGILPRIADSEVLAFFAGMTVRGPLHIDAAAVEPLIRESFAAPAIDTASSEAIWFYRVAENRMPPGQAANYAIFASGQLRYRGDARIDLNYWDYANYPLMP